MAEPARCEECGKEFKDARGLANHNRFTHTSAQPTLTGVYDEDSSSPEDTAEVTEQAIEGGERRPQAPTLPPGKSVGRGLFDRIRKEPPKDGGPQVSRETGKPETRPRPPKPRRVSTQAFWGDVIEASSSVVARTRFVPMARAMEMTSPVGGEIIEDATKGTLIDRGVQPLVRNAEKWQDLGDYLGFIMAIGIAQAQPEKQALALGFARKRLTNLLPKIAKNIVAQRKKEREAVEAIRTIMPELEDMGLELGDDPIGGLIAMLFGPPEGVVQPEPAVA